MSFASPWLLLGLLVVPFVVLGYVILEQERSRRAAKWSKSALMPNMVRESPGARRYVPLVLFLLGLILLLAGFARPQATINVPQEGAMVVLVVDVSGSMEAKDVNRLDGQGLTTRLLAARETATEFLEDLPDQYRVSLVTFGERGSVRVPPTREQDRVALALPTKAKNVSTALASGIESATKVVETGTAVEPGKTRPPAAVLLISDGSNSGRADPHEAAAKAAKLGVKIWTVLLGTSGRNSFVTQPIAGSPGNDQVIQVPVVEETLEDVAKTSGGTFFKAHTSKELEVIYKDLRSQLVDDKKKREITVGVAAAAIGFLVAGALLSGLWFRRLV